MNPITAADFHDLVQVGDPRLAPDGERVAFVRKTAADAQSSVATIHVVSTDGGDPRQFTVAEGVDSEPRWSPDGDFLAFVSTRGADDDRPQLWVLPTAGGEARQVTEVAGGVSGIEWSPDGSRIVFTQASTPEDREEGRDLSVDPEYEPETPDPRVIDRMNYRSMQRYADGKRNHVYVIDVGQAIEAAEAAGDDPPREDALTRLTDGDADYVGPAWGDDETVYYASKPEDEPVPDDSVVLDIYAHPLAGDDAPEVLTRTTGWGGAIEATTDGLVAFPRTPEERMSMRQTDIVVHDAETGEEVVPTEPLDRTLTQAGFQWGPDEERLFFATPDEGSVRVFSVPGDASTEPEPVYDDGAHVDGFTIGADAVAVSQSEWDHPGDVFLADRSDGDATRLTEVNADYFAEHAVAEPDELWFESDGAECQGWLLTPPSDVDESDAPESDEPYPLVVEIHGGPHVQWSTSGTMWHEFQTLAANGYAVFWSNPRGSTGYGEDHAVSTHRDWGDKTLEDVLAGVDLVSERSEIDADEQYVTGGSFGGYMTAWTVGRTDRFTAAVAQRGVYDLTGFYGSTDGAYKLVEYDFGTTPWAEPDFLWEHSPTSLVPEVDTPTLLLHSDRDYRTPANGAELYYTGLKKHRVDTRLVRYPREGHELSRSGEPGHVVDRIERIVRWFDGYADGKDVPPALERDPNAGLSAGADDEGADEEPDATEESDGDDA